MFNYFTCTDEELVNHIRNSSAAKISVAKKYHESKGNLEIVLKIEHARKKLKIMRLNEALSKLKEDF